MKILMVSTEYPPMRGGVGRYGANLVQALRERGTGIEVDVVCNEDGEGNFKGISPSNERNSDVLLKIVEEQSRPRSEEHTSELQSQSNLVCRLLLENKNG